jgi:CHAD domain-containing protein
LFQQFVMSPASTNIVLDIRADSGSAGADSIVAQNRAEPLAVTPSDESHAEPAPGMSAGQAFTVIGMACLRQLTTHETGTIKREPEALHQMRVALRRLRAAISLFGEVVSDDRVEAIKAELKWLGRELAPARDLDSLLIEVIKPLRKQRAGIPGFASVARIFERERLKSYRQVQAAVQSQRFRSLVADTTAWVGDGPWTRSSDAQHAAHRNEPIETLAAEQLSRRRKKIRRRGREIASLDAERLHALRIQVKKARYAVEFFSSLYRGKKSERRKEKFHAALRQLQGSLGGFNDIAMRKTLCEAILTRPGRNLTEAQNRQRAFAAGLIIGDQHAQAEQLLGRSLKAYARFDDVKPFWT